MNIYKKKYSPVYVTSLNIYHYFSDNFRKEAIKKEAKNRYQKGCRGLRVVTLQGAIEKSPKLLSQYWKFE